MMASATLSTRVTKLEKTVATILEVTQGQKTATGGWRRSIGMFDGDQIMKQIIERGAAIRRAESMKAKRG
jgi:hypothetical protein